MLDRQKAFKRLRTKRALAYFSPIQSRGVSLSGLRAQGLQALSECHLGPA